MQNSKINKPEWLKTKLPSGKDFLKIKDLVEKNKLNTICTSGKCPNIAECWACGTATFMILGNICTRSCKFCSVPTGKPLPPDENEPEKVANSIKIMKLKHAVITSVDRDDLHDYGASFWAKTITKIKEVNKNTTLETLIPDFNGDEDCLNKIIAVKPEIVSHNIETVERLTLLARNKALYKRSLKVIENISKSGLTSKSGLMLGIGELEKEVIQTINDLHNSGCKILTIGQYLQPTKQNLPVSCYIHPDKFNEYKNIAISIGFSVVESAPLVRSSFHAENHLDKNII